MTHDEIDQIRSRYERRLTSAGQQSWGLSAGYPLWVNQEKERALIELIRWALKSEDFSNLEVLDAGCGTGWTLTSAMRAGCNPRNLTGIDLMPHQIDKAREVLPSGVKLLQGDLKSCAIATASKDIVIVFTVFSSILDLAFRQDFAAECWRIVRPGGSVIVYDFAYNNPSNKDVTGISRSMLRGLFRGYASTKCLSVTLAPPLGRFFDRIWRGSYPVLNAIPMLRSHNMIALVKPTEVLVPPG